ncbi:MAG: hypothetical protein OXF26_08570, partial [Alphaproteobacteria bacterium]|nr:hypothetical protein [Alphaproteobacteria bacterium]
DPAIRRSGDPAIRRSGDYTGTTIIQPCQYCARTRVRDLMVQGHRLPERRPCCTKHVQCPVNHGFRTTVILLPSQSLQRKLAPTKLRLYFSHMMIFALYARGGYSRFTMQSPASDMRLFVIIWPTSAAQYHPARFSKTVDQRIDPIRGSRGLQGLAAL